MSESLLPESASPKSIELPSDVIEALYRRYSHLNDNVSTSNYTSMFSKFRRVPLINRLLPRMDEKTVYLNQLLLEQKTAVTYNQWHSVSMKLDDLLDNNSWKEDPHSDAYDSNLIQTNLNEMKSAREAKDFKLLLYLIRTKWIRNLGNMGDISLYRHSHFGTKKLIEEYIDECIRSLDYLIYDKEVTLDDHYLLGMLIQTRKNIGRTALVLSGGSTFGVFHIGVLITLLEANLLPRIISGSSSGSIIASIMCCHTNDEVAGLLGIIAGRRFNIFGDESKNLDEKKGKLKRALGNLSHFLKYGTLFDVNGLKQTMIDFVGDLTFKEAYNMTGKILNITVSPASIHEQIRLINYLTAPNCLVWSVVCASCSLPGVFPSTSIYEKDPKTNEIHEWNNDTSIKYVDGSVDNDLPIMRLLEMFNVDNIIAVQVNPHVVPILRASISNIGGEVENELSSKFKYLLNNVYDFLTCEVIHYLQILNEMDIYKNFSNKMISILSQSYSGNITILPDVKISDFKNILENPTPEFLVDFIIRGERASWPKITVIRNHCGVEFALDKAISLLRGRVITSKSKETRVSSPHHLNAENQNLSKNSHYTLVNSPVLNLEQEAPLPRTPERTTNPSLFAPNFQRVNSGPINSFNKQKRNSLSSLNPATRQGKKVHLRGRGKSTTSLASMNDSSIQKLLALYPETRLRDEDDLGYESTDKPVNRSNTISAQMLQSMLQPSGIRKAKSSGNFQNNDEKSPDRVKSGLKYQSERIPFYKNNPYLETDGKDKAQIPKETFNEQEAKSHANFPSISRSNSMKSNRSSHVGLNRLKDGSLSKSQNGSAYNLKEFKAEFFKSLNSPDIRRPLKNNRRESFGSLSFSPIDKIEPEEDSEIINYEPYGKTNSSNDRGVNALSETSNQHNVSYDDDEAATEVEDNIAAEKIAYKKSNGDPNTKGNEHENDTKLKQQ
ncbi:uncharacterized protein PRCAT00002305001 [Priceomyces carsonii]|uniref:uncharacterized protein n=1 Tax=Priceomyces carsonii TaxID=28549 RepID=UPI002ED7C226|nr:unnamed protein product [Priceomyces carsonii]